MNSDFRKPNKLFPKMFKTFTLYIVATLFVFFGYVYFFGDPKVIDLLPEFGSNATDDGYFGEFTQKLLETENVDTNFSLGVSSENAAAAFEVSGNVVFDMQTGMQLDLNFSYNGQSFDVFATYLAENSNLFLILNEKTYKINLNFLEDETSSLEDENNSLNDVNGGLEDKGSGLVSNFQGKHDVARSQGEYDQENQEEASEDFLGTFSLDFSTIFDIVSDVLGIDTSALSNFAESLGIDFENFDLNSLLSQLKIQENVRDDGNIEFKISLGSALNAVLRCDEKFNLQSLSLPNGLEIGNFRLDLAANVRAINDFDFSTGQSQNVEVLFDEGKAENVLDLAFITSYTKSIQKMFSQNDFVNVQARFSLPEQASFSSISSQTFSFGKTSNFGASIASTENSNGLYVADLLYDKKNGALQVSTQISGTPICITIFDSTLFVQAGGVKVSFKLADASVWTEKLDQLLKTYAQTDFPTFLKQLLKNFLPAQNNSSEMNLQNLLRQLFGFFANENNAFASLLPKSVTKIQNGHSIVFENFDVDLQNLQNNVSLLARTGENEFLLSFSPASTGLLKDELQDFYDASSLLPFADFVDSALKEKGMIGSFEGNIFGAQIDGQIEASFEKSFALKICAQLLGEQVVLQTNQNNFTISLGGLCLQGNFENLENYLQKIDEIFSISQSTNAETQTLKILSSQQIFVDVLQFLNNLKIYGNNLDDPAVFVEYLSQKACVWLENKACVGFSASGANFEIFGKISAQKVGISALQHGQDLESFLENVQSVKQFVLGDVVSFRFDLTIFDSNLSGKFLLNQKTNTLQISDVKFGNMMIDVVIKNNTAFVEVQNVAGAQQNAMKLRFDVGQIEKFVQVLEKCFGQNSTTTMLSLLNAFGLEFSNFETSNFSNSSNSFKSFNSSNSENLESSNCNFVQNILQKMLNQLLCEIFGQDIELSLPQFLQGLQLQIFASGPTSAAGYGTAARTGYGANLTYVSDTGHSVFANLQIGFKQHAFYGAKANFNNMIVASVFAENVEQKAIVENEYYNITSAHRGTIELNLNLPQSQQPAQQKNELKFVANVEMDLDNTIYLHAWTTLLGVNLDILLTEEGAQLKISDLAIATNFENMGEIFNFIQNVVLQQNENSQNKISNSALNIVSNNPNNSNGLNVLNGSKKSSSNNLKISSNNSTNQPLIDFIKQLLNAFSNGFSGFDEGLTCNFGSANATVAWNTSENLSLKIELRDDQTLFTRSQILDSADATKLLPTFENLLKYLRMGVFEFDFNISYNGNDVSNLHQNLDFGGTLKIYAPNFARLLGGQNSLALDNASTWPEIEICNMVILGQKTSMRVHDGILYLAFGNTKLKLSLQNFVENAQTSSQTLAADNFALQNKQTAVIISAATQTFGALGIEVDFGIFENLLNILSTYTLQDYINNINLSIQTALSSTGDLQKIDVRAKDISNKNVCLANIQIGFEEKMPSIVCIGLLGEDLNKEKTSLSTNAQANGNSTQENVLSATFKIIHSTSSTITPFRASDYAAYCENALQAILQPLQVQEDVYALSGNIAIRYNSSTFYGNLALMLVEDQVDDNADGKGDENDADNKNSLQNFALCPAVALKTNALGFSTYIYIIRNTLYLDISGLQVKAELSQYSLDEILGFLQENFGMFGNTCGEHDEKAASSNNATSQNGQEENLNNFEALSKAETVLSVLLPALDKIYATWVAQFDNGKLNGIQIETSGVLQIDDLAISDIVAQIFVSSGSGPSGNYGNVSLSQLILGANIFNLSSAGNVGNTGNAGNVDKNAQNNVRTAQTNALAIAQNNVQNGQQNLLKNLDGSVLERNITQNLNFALYITNIKIGRSVGNLSQIFVPSNGEDLKNFSSVASNQNGGKTKLNDFSTIQTVLSSVQGTIAYLRQGVLDIGISGFVKVGGNTINLDGSNIFAQIKDLPENQQSTSGFSLFANKNVSLQAQIFMLMQNKKHEIDIAYQTGVQQRSNITSGTSNASATGGTTNTATNLSELFFTYQMEKGNKISAKISDENIVQIFDSLMQIFGGQSANMQGIVENTNNIINSVESFAQFVQLVTFVPASTPNGMSCLEILLNTGSTAKISIYFAKQSGANACSIQISNLNLAGTEINLRLDFARKTTSTYNYFSENPAKEHLNLSGFGEVFKAAANMRNLSDFHITANINLNINIIGIKITATMPLDVQIKLDENKNPTIMASLEIPTLVFVNNDVPYQFGDTESGHDRTLKIYYKNGFVYFYRSEIVDQYFGITSRTYEKRLKTTLDAVLEDPMYYLQYASGLSDGIMNMMYEILENAKNRTPDLSKVVKSVVVDSHKMNFDATLDMQEILGDARLGDLTFGVSLVCNSKTGFENYIGAASFEFDMPFASVMNISMQSNDITLHIGQSTNVVEAEKYILAHGSDACDAQYQASDGNWELVSQKKYCISFQENGGPHVSDVYANAFSTISMPYVPSTFKHTQAGKTYTYHFDGWFTSSDFQENTRFTQTVMPRRNIVLYAKWTSTDGRFLVNLDTCDGNQIYKPFLQSANTIVNVSTLTPTKESQYIDLDKYVSGKGYLYEAVDYQFAGWFTDEACLNKFDGTMPNCNITLYAGWKEIHHETYFQSSNRP